jgi:hypothetical protein
MLLDLIVPALAGLTEAVATINNVDTNTVEILLLILGLIWFSPVKRYRLTCFSRYILPPLQIIMTEV